MLLNGSWAIVNCSSIASTMAFGGLGLYAAAKAGVNALTRNAAVEYSAQEIRTVAIAPGAIKTELQQQAHAQLSPKSSPRSSPRPLSGGSASRTRSAMWSRGCAVRRPD